MEAEKESAEDRLIALNEQNDEMKITEKLNKKKKFRAEWYSPVSEPIIFNSRRFPASEPG
jgi:hypothetical protein